MTQRGQKIQRQRHPEINGRPRLKMFLCRKPCFTQGLLGPELGDGVLRNRSPDGRAGASPGSSTHLTWRQGRGRSGRFALTNRVGGKEKVKTTQR